MADPWASFLTSLAQTVDSGLAMGQAVRLSGAAAGGEPGRLAPGWATAVEQGRSLGDCCAESGVDPVIVAVITAGHDSGRLPELCRLLAQQREFMHGLRQAALGRLVYPTLLAHAALIMPVLLAVIAGKAPLWAIVIGPLLLWLLIAGAVLIYRRDSARKTLWLRQPFASVVWPLLTARAAVAQAAVTAAGLSADRAMELVGAASGHPVIEARLCAAAQRLRSDGRTGIAAAWSAAGFPTWATAPMATGEISGRLEESALQVAREAQFRFQQRAEWAAKIITGGLYTVAAMLAIAAIFWMFYTFYLGPIYELAKGIP